MNFGCSRFFAGIQILNRERKWRVSVYLSDCLSVSHEPRFVHVCEIHVSLNPWCDFSQIRLSVVLTLIDWHLSSFSINTCKLTVYDRAVANDAVLMQTLKV